MHYSLPVPLSIASPGRIHQAGYLQPRTDIEHDPICMFSSASERLFASASARLSTRASQPRLEERWLSPIIGVNRDVVARLEDSVGRSVKTRITAFR